MSSISKLRIQGVRAFDNYTAQDLEFTTPLTLICGPNGVGKTTVIECLRYATTGDLPPNAKGGAFVHDPRMASESEVYAQVKLLYRNASGRQMVATRSMRLSITGKGTATFKTLEGQLRVYGNDFGDSGAVSSRCADLNVQIPQSLGVPAAILNYVVFCHQEDSLWPLAEPSVVKKRFDEIFEATKYSKALESLKTIRKEYMANVRVEKVELEHLETDQARVAEKQVLLESLSTRVDDLGQSIVELQEERRSRSEELMRAVEHSQRVQQLEYSLKDSLRVQSRLQTDMEILRGEMREELAASTAELEAELAQSDEREAQLGKEAASLDASRVELHSELESVRQTLAALANQQGRIEQAQDAQMEKMRQRDELVGDHSGADGLSSSPLSAWRKERELELAIIEEEMEKLEIFHREREEELSRAVSSAEAQRLQLRKAATDSRSTIRACDAKISEIQKALEEHKGSDSSWLLKRLEEVSAEAEDADKRSKEYEAANTLKDALSRVGAEEEKVSAARCILQDAIDVSSAQSRLIFLKDSQTESEDRLRTAAALVRSHIHGQPPETGDTLSDVAELEAAAEKELSDSTSGKASAALAVDSTKAKLEGKQSMLTSIKQKMATLSDEEKALGNEVGEIASSYEDSVSQAEAVLVEVTQDQEQIAFAHRFFSEALSRAEQDSPVCILCDHHKTASEVQAFIAKLKVKLQALSLTPEEAEAEASSKKQELEHLRSLAPIIQRWRQIKSDLHSMNAEVETLEHDVGSLQQDLEAAKEAAAKQDERHAQLIANISGPLNQLARSRDEVLETTAKINAETVLLTPSVSISPQAAQKDLETRELELKHMREAAENARAEKERLAGRVSTLAQSVQELKLRIRDSELAQAKRERITEELARTVESRESAQTELEAAQEAIPRSEAVIEAANDELRSQKHDFAEKERDVAVKKSEAVALLRRVDELSSEIARFETTHGTDPLGRIAVERAKSLEQEERVSGAINELALRISENERLRVDFLGYRRNLNDNIRLRRITQEHSTVSEESAHLEVQVKDARAEIGDYETHITSLQDRVGTLNAEISTKTGEAKALREQMIQVRRELSTTYKDTAERFNAAVAKLQTTEGAAKDLEKYVRALDIAIMRYHSMKMAEINALLDEMWKSTYTGTDIDTILIRSESDAGSASARASYNYRVCMLKQDTELDMRGRCSAGQKVLASILIRMALAECFGNNSGLIVLDEPTTNLDRDNIEALARSLADIIAARRSQRNFQLIVITHDEQFLAQMSPSNYCSYYYRIERDSRQLSTIHKLPITSLS